MSTFDNTQPATYESDYLERVNPNQSESDSAQPADAQGSEDIRSVLRLCGPALLARYVLHQARVCHQSVDDLASSLRRYRDALRASPHGELDWFGVGDLWSGLLWWRDEATWVGKTGALTRQQVQQLILEVLNEYLLRLERGCSHDYISASVSNDRGASATALRLMRELTSDGSNGEFRAPGFRAVVSYAVCELGLTWGANAGEAGGISK